MPPVVCKFWQQGTCRNGDRCRFQHPENQAPQSNGNRFAPLQNTNANPRNTFKSGGASNPQAAPYNLDRAAIIADLTTERPQWILSAYGPGRNAPEQLFGGPMREQSFEEMRVLFYMNPQPAIREEQKLVQASELQNQNALSNVDAAIDYIIKAENKHPNRLDTVKESQAGTLRAAQPTSLEAPPSQPPQGAFGAPSAPAVGAGAFGQPSALGQKPNPFDAAPESTFGAPSQLGAGAGAFGQPATLGQKPNPFGAPSAAGGVFGQPAALGQKPNPFGAATPSTFGAPSQPAAGAGAFGQPAALGQKPNPFGAASQPTTTNAFGAPSQTATMNAFGAPSQPAQTTPFGQPAGQGYNPFGPANPPSQPNPFGARPGAPLAGPSPGAPNPFGGASQPGGSNPFGGASTSQPNPFGSAAATVTAPNPFSKPQSGSQTTVNPFGGANPIGQLGALTVLNGDASRGSDIPISAGHPPLESYSTRDATGRLNMFKGKRVVYKEGQAGVQNRDGSWSKIWFPEGAPAYYKDTEMEDSAYDESTKEAYVKMRQAGSFQGGVMPLVPPKREWCLWNF